MFTIQPISNSAITAGECSLPTNSTRVRAIMNTNRGGRLLKNINIATTVQGNFKHRFDRDQKGDSYGAYDRAYCNVSPVTLEKSIRAGIWGDTCYYIDQSCSQQRAMVSALENDANELEPRSTYSALYHYVENKDEERERVAHKYFGGNRAKAKNVYQALTFGGSARNALTNNGYDKPFADEQLSNFVDNLKLFSIMAMDKNPDVLATVQAKVTKTNKSNIKKWLKKNPGKTENDAMGSIKIKVVSSCFLALWGRNKEQLCTESAVHFLIDNNIIRDRAFSPCYDGVLMPKAGVDEYGGIETVISDCNAHVKASLGFDVVYEHECLEKECTAFLETLSCNPDKFKHWKDKVTQKFAQTFFKNLKTQEQQKVYWEMHFCYCIDQRKTGQLLTRDVQLNDGTIETDRTLTWFSDVELMSSYGNLDHCTKVNKEGDPEKFVKIWLKDPDRRQYNYVDVLPYAGSFESGRGCTEDVFNAFVGYPRYIWGANTSFSKSEMNKLLEPFFTMVMHLVGCKSFDKLGKFNSLTDDDKLKFDTVMHLVGHRIMKPEEKKLPYALLIKSIQGTGKNTFVDVLTRLVGATHSKCSSNIEDFCGDHAEGLIGKLFCVMNEAEISKTGKHKNAIKEIISEAKSTCNIKYQRPFEFAVMAMVVVLSNEACPINLDTAGQDRRWIVMEANDFCAKRWGQGVWKQLHKHFAKPEFLQALKQYFMGLDYDAFDYKNAKRANNQTKAYKNVSHYFTPSELGFFQNYIENAQFADIGFSSNAKPFYETFDKTVTVKCADLYECARTYFTETHNDTALQKKYKSFNNSITKFNLPIEKTNEKSGSRSPMWVFNPKAVYAWLIAGGFVDQDDVCDEAKELMNGMADDSVELDFDDIGFDI